MIRYRVVKDILQPDKFAVHELKTIDGTATVTRMIPVVTSDPQALESLIQICNALHIAPAVMDQVIQDFMSIYRNS